MQAHRSSERTKRKKLFPRLIISVPSIIFWLSVALFDRSMQTSAALTATALHELGHIAVMGICGMRVTGITVLPYGLEMTSSRPPCSFREDIAVNAAGCAVNLISYPLFHALGTVIHGKSGEFMLMLSFASFALGILNAFPITSLDGGSVTEAILSLFLSPTAAYRTVRAVSFIFLVILWVLATYIFMLSGYNYSLFAMAIWLFARVFLSSEI